MCVCCVCGVFRCRRTSVWIPSSRLCREWPSLFTKTLLQHLNALGTKESITFSWWVPKSKSWVSRRLCRINNLNKQINSLSFIIVWRDRVFLVRSCLQTDTISYSFCPKSLLFLSLKFKGFMSQDPISAKYKGIIVALLLLCLRSPFCLLL